MTIKGKIYKYSFDGKTFIAYATSISNFLEIMRRNSSWGRYSLQHIRGYTRELHGLGGLSGLIAKEMFKEGFEGVWIHKFIADENFGKLFEVSGMSGDYILMRKDEYTKLMSSNINQLKERLDECEVKLKKIREVVKQ